MVFKALFALANLTITALRVTTMHPKSTGLSTAFTWAVLAYGALISTIAETMDMKTCFLVAPSSIA